MKISTFHQRLSNRLKNPRVLENPEEFLGPNWKAVLNFWIYVDTLKNEQWNVIVKRYCDMSNGERSAAYFVAVEAARKTTPYCGDVFFAAHGAGYATWEIIASHELLNQQKPYTFLSLYLNQQKPFTFLSLYLNL